MTTTKHKLTTGKDHITGKAGIDLFVGTKGELGSNDVLNGAGGIDTISAVLTGKHLAPVMKNIEKGNFSIGSSAAVTLDLVHAAEMKALTLHGFGQSDGLAIRNAAHLSALTLRNVTLPGDIKITGIDASVVKTEKLVFDFFTEKTLTLKTVDGGAFDKLDITLKRSYYETLAGDVAARSIAIHSLGNDANYIEIAPSGKHDVHKLAITGKADVVVRLAPDSSDELSVFDASRLHAGAITLLASHTLHSVLGGSGDDQIRIEALGGTKASKATVSLGAGDDLLDVSDLLLNAAKMHFTGGSGYDTLGVFGHPSNIGAIQGGFEELMITAATGTYHLGTGWKGLSFSGGVAAADNVFVQDSSGLKSVHGSFQDDHFGLGELGGTASSKAIVDLDSGNDFVSLYHMTLNAATQAYIGGDGNDGFDVNGNVADLGALFQGFEYAYIYNASGSYDLSNSGLHALILASFAGTVAFENVASGALMQVLSTEATLVTVDVADASSLTSDMFRVELYGNADLGNNIFGLDALDLSTLEIASFENAHTVYLSQLGGSSDAATLEISGNSKLTLIATLGSTSYIDEINVTNTAGLDMSGLLDGTHALASSGVTISGGSGDDVLVGGIGADTISSGGGDNIIEGSLGIDNINVASGALDTLVFHSQGQSAFTSGDNVSGFNIFDGIDISDIVSSVSFGGNVATFGAGVATLSASHSVGFYDTANHTLYVDINHDAAIDAAHDMEFHLTGLSSFNSTSLIG